MASRRRAATIAAMAVGSAAVVMAPAGRAQLPTCSPGTSNALYCQTIGMQQPQGTTVRGTVLSANVCRARRAPVRLSETISAASGIRRVTVSLDGHVIKSQKSGHLSLTIGVRKLRTGIHTLKITVVDRAGRKTTRTMHFRLCSAALVPKFTG